MFVGILKRRGLIVGLALAILFAGYQAYLQLAMEAYPDIANLQVRVITQVAGKAAEEIERIVTIPLEKELTGIPDADAPRSISIFGLSVITVVFADGVDPYRARQQVLEKISQAGLPPGIQPRLDPNASLVGEVYRYSVESTKWTSMARKEWQDWFLERKFKCVPGVADVTGFGGPTKLYQVELDPDQMKSLGITQAQLASAISSSNASTGGSYIIRNGQDYMVRGLGLLSSVDDIRNVVIASKDGIPITVKDVANVHIGPAGRKGQVGKNDDDDAVEGIVLMRRGENPSRTVDNLKAAWGEIQASLPPGMKLEPLYDRTALVRRTTETIGHNVAEGITLVVVILMLFMFQVRSALIASVSIPMALASAMILLNVFKIPANLLSLGAIDFGIIVHASVVMVENIVRHLSDLRDRQPKDRNEIFLAIYRAAGEVARPIIFATSIIVLAFLPIFTFERVEGKLFRPLAVMMNFQLAGAVLAALTVVPVLCIIFYSRRLPSERRSPIMEFAVNLYKPVLRWSMVNRWKAAAIGLSAVALGLVGASFLGAEFLPELEEGNIWLRVTVLPSSVALDKSVDIARQVRQILRSYPEVTNVVSQVGAPDDGTDPNNYSNIEFFVDLKPQDQWRKQFQNKEALVDSMDSRLNEELPELLYNFSQYIKDNMDEAIAGVKGELGIKLYGKDLEVLSKLGNQIRHIVEKVPGMVDVATDQLLGQPQLLITIDRARASRYGISSNDVLDVVETSIGGKAITDLLEGERRFAVVVRYQKQYRDDPAVLQNILLPTASGARIPLSQLADIVEAHGASSILRDQNDRRIAVKANIRGRDLCSAVTEAQQLVTSQVILPPGYRITWEGQFKRAQHAMTRLCTVIPITLTLMFILLYAYTGSARIALLVLLTVPLAVPGAVLLLLITHTHFSISAGVGFVALSGVAVQNGVVLVSLVEQLRKEGVAIQDAVAQSALIRMKPALMASTVAAAGLLPAALSTAIGSQSQRPLAMVIVGGIIPGVMLALIVLPAMYEVFDRGFKRPKEPKETPASRV